MSIKIFNIKKTSDFSLINKFGSKFFLKDIIIIQYQNPDPKLTFLNPKNNNIKLHDQSDHQQNLIIDKNNLINCRVGYTISKSVSKLSTTRNLIKRRLKSVVKNNHKLLQSNHDYVFIARKTIVESSFAELEKNIKFALKKLIKNEQK